MNTSVHAYWLITAWQCVHACHVRDMCVIQVIQQFAPSSYISACFYTLPNILLIRHPRTFLGPACEGGYLPLRYLYLHAWSLAEQCNSRDAVLIVDRSTDGVYKTHNYREWNLALPTPLVHFRPHSCLPLYNYESLTNRQSRS